MNINCVISSTGSPILTPQQKIMLSRFANKKAIISIPKRKRTLTQLNYIYVLFEYLAEHTGHSKEEIKTIEKRRHLTPKEVEFKGQKHLVLPSLSTISNPDISELIEKVLADCASEGIVVPDRESLGYLPK